MLPWQEAWLPEGVRGATPGHDCLNVAWPAQARLEAAMLQDEHRAAATLDYSKYFDRFDPSFYMDMLVDMG